MMSWIDLHKFADVIFGITQKLLYIITSNLIITWTVTGHYFQTPFVFDNFVD